MLRCRHIASLWACSLLLVTIFAGHASGQGAKDKGGPVLRELEPIWRRTNELIDAGRYKEAEASARQSVARAQALVGADHRAASRGYHDLARVLILEGRYQEAEQLARRGLVIRERDLGPTAEPVSFSLTTLAQALGGQGRDTEAEDAFRRALAIREQHSGQQGYEYARLIRHLGWHYEGLGRIREAEPLFQRSAEIMLRVFGPLNIETIRSRLGLAKIKQRLGRLAEAEDDLASVIAHYEKLVGTDHPEYSDALRHLAVIKVGNGQLDEAEPLQRRSIAVSERTRGATHRATLFGQRNLGDILARQNRTAEAEQLFRHVLSRLQGAELRAETLRARTHQSIGGLMIATGRPTEAVAELDAALQIFGGRAANSAYAAGVYYLLGAAQVAAGRHQAAEAAFDQSIAAFARTLGPGHQGVAGSLAARGASRLAAGRDAEALEDYRKASAIINRRMELYNNYTQGRNDPHRSIEARRRVHGGHIRAAWTATQSSPARKDELANEALQSLQRMEGSSASASLAQMAARLAAEDDAQALLIRRSQDLSEQWQSLSRELTEALGTGREQLGDAARTAIRQRMATIDGQLAEAMAQLRREFPAYAGLMSPAPLGIDEIRRLIGPTEALVVFHLGATESFVWLVSREAARWQRLELTADEVSNAVARLRAGLDPSQLGKPGAQLFDLGNAHDLYLRLLGPVASEISGKSHLLLVLPGALSALPMQLLVTAKPPEAIPSDPARYADAAWLIKRHALSTLPSVASLQALRALAQRNPAVKPFIGFGDPHFGPITPLPERQAPSTRTVAPRGTLPFAKAFKGAVVNVSALRKSLQPLSDTADEIKAVARTLGANPSDLKLGLEAVRAPSQALAVAGLSRRLLRDPRPRRRRGRRACGTGRAGAGAEHP